MTVKPVPLQRGVIYHIYNQGNNRDTIFRERRNYLHFLTLYAQHISPIANTYAYCLLNNHFHLATRLKTTEEIVDEYEGDVTSKPLEKRLKRKPSQAFANFFNAYTRSFNNSYGRSGSLFKRPFSRIPIQNRRYFHHLITYIHQNPVKHGFVTDFRNWPFSSYRTLLSTQPTKLARDQVLDWFDGTANFKAAHQAPVDPTPIRGWLGDEAP